jgi:L,D-transpeptidase YcbB
MKTLFTILFFIANVVFAQENISALALEKNIKITETEKDEALENLALQMAYGHKPKLLKYQELDEKVDSTIAQQWLNVAKKAKYIDPLLSFLEPDFAEYTASLNYKFHPNYPDLSEFQNFFRWINRFEHNQFILINVASNTLTLYHKTESILEMKVILGTYKNKTPIMATVADAVMIYPYWTPTKNIATKEILPMVQKDIRYLARNNFEVLDANSKIIDPYKIDWTSLNATNLPYKFRQGTGCDNALGLLKINIKNPYSIYLHDVPHTEHSKSLFEKEKRFFSHGCIRLQEPLKLANLMNPMEQINQNLLETCLINEKPKVIELVKPIPIFVMYFTNYIDKQGEWQKAPDYYKYD